MGRIDKDVFGPGQLESFSKEIDKTFMRKEEGKGLSTNDFDDTYKELLDTLDRNTDMKINVLEYDAENIQLGQTIENLTLHYELSKVPSKIVLDGKILDITKSHGDINLENLNFKENTTLVFEVYDRFGNIDRKEIEVKFVNGVYLGVGPAEPLLNGRFVNTLDKINSEEIPMRLVTTAGEKEYIYVAVPCRINTNEDIDFMYGSFVGGFMYLGKVDVINERGYSEPFDVFRSAQPNLGYMDFQMIRD